MRFYNKVLPALRLFASVLVIAGGLVLLFGVVPAYCADHQISKDTEAILGVLTILATVAAMVAVNAALVAIGKRAAERRRKECGSC